MDFIEPHDGAVLICSPMTRRVNLWPFGVGHFPKLNVHPNSSFIDPRRWRSTYRSFQILVLYFQISES